MTLHINCPETATNEVMIHFCPDCQCDRFFHVDSQIWYGATHTCLTCLRQFQDGFRLCNPFERNWKKDRMSVIMDKINLGKFNRITELLDEEDKIMESMK